MQKDSTVVPISNKPKREKHGGRKKGTPNRRSVTQAEIAGSGMSPLEFLLMVMRDAGEDMPRRVTAAQAAAPYCHAKLSSVELTGKDGAPMQTVTRIELIAMTK